MLDFSNTRWTFNRHITDYAKIRVFITALIRNRSLFFKPLPKKLYLDIGCGPNIDPDFYNLDYSWRPGIDRCVDITKGLQLPDNSILGVFTEHCIEHIEIEDTQCLLGELWRSMSEGSVMRIVVPDAELHANTYLDSLDSGINITPFAGTISKCGISTPVMSLNSCVRGHGHRFIYDYQTIRELLRSVGFSSIHRRKFREGADARLLKDSEERRIESLYVEAIK